MPTEAIPDVVVLGAGVVGVASAYALARRGLSVALVDRELAPGRGTSFANGAQLSYAYTDTLGSPSLIGKLPKILLGLDPGIAVKPSFDPDFLAWGLRFLRNCTRERHVSGTLAVLALAAESRLALHALLERHRIEFNHQIAGKMHLLFDAGGLAASAEMSALKRRHGAVQEVLTAREAVAIEPALSDAKGLAGVVYTPGDAVGDPSLFCRGLTDVLAEHYGVTTHFGSEIQDIQTSGEGIVLTAADDSKIRGRTLVIALGPQAKPVLRTLGIHVPIMPMKGYSITAPPGSNAPNVSLTDTKRKIVFCRLGNRIRVAGGAEVGNGDTAVNPRNVQGLVDAARASLPYALDTQTIEPGWSGLRPMTPDSFPILSQPRANIFLNVGHGMLGWTLSMGTAERLAAMVLASGSASALA
jgi:D-amino-acid dehydrogenase